MTRPTSRSYSTSPIRNRSASVEGRSSRGPLRRKLKGMNPPDLDDSVSSSISARLNSSIGSLEIDHNDDLDFLVKSPAGHQWRNKKHWNTNSNAIQKKFERCSVPSYKPSSSFMSPQQSQRAERRKNIRDALIDSMIGV